MKKLLLLLALFGNYYLAPAQEAPSGGIYNAAMVDKLPEYPDGMSNFYKYISGNFIVPNVPNLNGKIFVSFVVDIDGSVTDIKVLRDIGHGTKQEITRVLHLSPKWKPGELNGKPVRVLYSLPVNVGRAK